MKYAGPGVPPGEIAQKARELQQHMYERNCARNAGVLNLPGSVSDHEFNKLVNIVTALAEASEWMMNQMHDHGGNPFSQLI